MLRFDRSEKSTFFEQLISMPWNHLVVWRSIFIECWVSFFFFLLINEDVFLWISRFSVSVRNKIIFPFCFAEDVNSLRGWGEGGATHDYQGNLATMIPQSVFLRKMSFHVFILLLVGNI